MTKPEPSIRLRQLGAVPMILTTEPCELRTTGELARAGSGASTSRAGVGVRSPKTLGKSPSAMVSRRLLYSTRALFGITESTAPRITLLRIDRDSPGNDDEPSGPATI